MKQFVALAIGVLLMAMAAVILTMRYLDPPPPFGDGEKCLIPNRC